MSERREWARRRRHRRRVLLALAAIIASFVLGLALGAALDDNPQPGGTQTVILTLKP